MSSFPLPDASSAEITATDAAASLGAPDARWQLVDCREPDEWAVCRIGGAVLVPLSQFVERAPSVLSRDRPILVYCHHGMRSMRATQWLRHQGFQAWSLAGGIDGWSQTIDRSVPRY